MMPRTIQIFIAITLLLFTHSLQLSAQKATNHTQIEELLESSNFDSAKVLLEQILLDIPKNQTSEIGTINSLITRCLIGSSKYDLAENKIQKSIDDQPITLSKINLILQQSYIQESYYKNPQLSIELKHKALKQLKAQNQLDRNEFEEAFDISAASLKYNGLKGLAITHRNIGQFDSARYYFEQISLKLDDYLKKDLNHFVLLEIDMVVTDLIQGRPNNAKRSLENLQAKVESLDTEKTKNINTKKLFLNTLAYTYGRLGQQDSANWVTEKSLDLLWKTKYPDSISIASTLSNLGVGYYNTGNIKKSLDYTIEAYNIKKRILPEDHKSLASSYIMLGLHESNRAFSLNKALLYFKEALRITEKQYGEYHPETIRSRSYVATIYSILGQHEYALEHHQNSLEMQLKLQGENNADTAEKLIIIGSTLQLLERNEEAMEYYNRFFSIVKRISADTRVLQSRAYRSIGTLLLDAKKYNEAVDMFRKSEKKLTEIYGDQHIDMLLVLNEKSRALFYLKEYSAALSNIERALKINRYINLPYSNTSSPIHWSYKDKIQLIESLLLRTKVKLLKDDHGWESFLETERVIQEMISEQSSRSDLIQVQTYSHRLYSIGIENLWNSNDRHNSYEQMWLFVEKSKAVSLKVDNILKQATNQVYNSLGFSQKEILESKIDSYKSRIINGEDNDSIRAKLFSLQLDKDRLQDSINRNKIDEAYDAIFTNNPKNLNLIQKNLEPDSELIDYFVGNDSLYSFIITNHEISVKNLGSVDKIQEVINDFNSAITKEKYSEERFSKVSNELYQIIFEPIEQFLSEGTISISPSSTLWGVNFDLLIDNKNEYLLNKYSFGYTHSLGALFLNNNHTPEKNEILGFASGEKNKNRPSEIFRDKIEAKLPGTAIELDKISDLMPGKFLYGSKAEESKFKALAPQYAVIHLALHGQANNFTPENSKLIFSEAYGDSIDSELYSFEIENIPLQAELVVLSACESGAGKATFGEGLISLGRSFSQAGAKSVIMSKWDVSDAVSPKIMSSFYQHIYSGKNKAEALRLAKLDYLKEANSITSNPYYWGSFFIVGNLEPISLKKESDHLYILIVLVLLIATFFVIRKARSFH